MGFKLKSGNKPQFKQIGSSPAKHGTTDDFLYGRNGHNPDTMEGKHEDWHTDKIEAEKKKPSPAKHFVDDVPEHNDGHSDDLQTPEEHEKGKVESPAKQMEGDYPKSFNIKGSKGSTTPRYKDTKAAKHKQSFDKFQAQKQKGKEFVKNLKTKGDLVSKKAVKEGRGKLGKTTTKKAFKKGAKQVLKKVGSKFLGPAGIALGAIDAVAIAGHSYDEGSLKKGVKKWWDDPGKGPGGIIPKVPKGMRYKKKKKSPAKQYVNPSDRKKEAPGQYWYKINNKPVTKTEYIKYKNKPGGDEPGKQTNDPSVSLAKKSVDKRIKINK